MIADLLGRPSEAVRARTKRHERETTETSLRDFYGSVLNGGAVNYQKGFDFGNESDGWYYAGSCWTYGVTLAAGVPAAGRLSAHPYDAAQTADIKLDDPMLADLKSYADFLKNEAWLEQALRRILK